jgi:hypothetical protein
VGARQPHETPAVDLPGPWLTARERAEAGSAQRQQQMRPDQEASPPSSRLPRLRDPRSAASPTPAHGGTAALASPASIDSRNRDGTHAGGQAASDDTCERPFGETTALAEPACQPFPSHVPQLVAATAVPAGHHDALNLEVPAPPAHQAQSVLQLAGVNALRSEFLAAMVARGRGASAVPVQKQAGNPSLSAPDRPKLAARGAAGRKPPSVAPPVIQGTVQPPMSSSSGAGAVAVAADARVVAGAPPAPNAAPPAQRGQTIRDVVLAVR